MSEELEKKLSDEKVEQMIGRICDAHAKGILKIRDWMSIYDILIDACEREKADTLERYLADQFKSESDAE